MKYVINSAWGGFEVPDEIRKQLNCSSWDTSHKIRTSPELIDWVENHRKSDLTIVVIPENATDFMVTEYDGLESVYAVINGKIVYLSPIDEDDE